MKERKIVLVENKPPLFEGSWSVGEVLQMARSLSIWIEQLQVSQGEPDVKQQAEEVK